MVFPAVTRPVESMTSGTRSSAPLAAPELSKRAAVDRDSFAALEACLAEVRLLEQGHVPLAEHRWAARYRAVGEVRNTELTAYWWRHGLMAVVHAALVIAAVAAGSAGTLTATALAAVSALGLGLDLAWAVAARGGARRLAHWEARLEAFDDNGPTSREPLGGVAEPSRPSPIAGSSVLIVVFGAFWLAALLGWLIAGDFVIVTIGRP